MTDFKGVQELVKFISNCKGDFSVQRKIDELSKGVQSLEVSTSSKSLSCRLCGIVEFSSLTEFKAHRQSAEHLSKLNADIDNSQVPIAEEEEGNQKAGSPFLNINHQTHTLTIYKALIVAKKEPLYDQLTINLDYDLFTRLESLGKANVLIALNGGGYFAAALFSLPQERLIASKTFKRYTSRRKQGGTQSSKDNASSGNIHSAGAIIRRENEKKLREEIAGLFEKWEADMNQVVIFCNRDPFLLDALLKYGNVKTLPFTTYQACFEEVSRCFFELFTIKLE